MAKHDFYQSGRQFEKAKVSKNYDTQDYIPRETPHRQIPGEQGYAKPDFEAWTDEELVEHARKLNLELNDSTDRETLIEELEQQLSLKS